MSVLKPDTVKKVPLKARAPKTSTNKKNPATSTTMYIPLDVAGPGRTVALNIPSVIKYAPHPMSSD